ncbi:MAG: zinc-binding dehydrogenase [Flavobacteriaceae bacterium]|jgi:NADPH:quinone reductase-like Zn-dependent oxidoreductase|nr:zinc-binding dehydrogenase [Flavobacteriaceae bacterium]MDG1791485.1 zinc-binding dehydrogenase [Flavobacteriaceae bacterium]MDG2447088.1 zinc-binding dehydrogenase [Flavobacteriaceae bacterium]|tara:strand:+ start:18129 stop:19241 length:1113 start_codon:yes stop_codon:yes gene_type:complete
MSDFLKKLKSLPPEKQAELLAKLTKSKNKAVKSEIDFLKNFEYYFKSDMPFDFTIRQTEISDPEPDYVQIRAKASSLNFRDVMIASKQYPSSPGVPTNMGSDYAGIVEKVGANVNHLKLGDEVISIHIGHTEGDELRDNCHFIKTFNVHKECVCLKPKNVSFVEASCIPTVFLTAYIGLIKLGRLDKAENLLLHTASGGVGLSAVQIAKWKEANIYATAGTDEKRGHLRKVGIKNIYDSRSIEFAKTLRSKGVEMDIVLNTLAGKAMFESIKLLNPFGRFIHIDKKDIAKDTSFAMQLFKNGIVFQFLDISLLFLNPKLMNSSMREIVELFEEEAFKPIYHTIYPVQDLKKAITAMSRGTHIGKLVVTYD